MFRDDELFIFDLQLFADLPDVEDDDGVPDTDTQDDEEEEPEVDIEDLLKGVADDTEEEETEPESGEEPGDDTEETEEESEEEPETAPLVTQEEIDEIVNQRVIAEVNRIIPERLARDRKTQQVQQIEKLTGMPLEQVRESIINNLIEAKAEELGCSVEEAKMIIQPKLDLATVTAEKEQETSQKNEVLAAMQQLQYTQDKSNYLRKPKLAPIVKACETEIDAFTKNGSILSFEDGMKYVLGQKLASGELIDNMTAGAEQKALRNNAQKKKAAPSIQKGGGNKSTTTLTKEERQYCANLGVDPKDYAVEKLAEENRRKGKRR